MNKTISAMEARDQFGEVLNEVYYHGDTITIERRGKPMAVIVPVQFMEARQQALDRIAAIAEETSQMNKDVPSEAIDAEILKAVREVRRKKKS